MNSNIKRRLRNLEAFAQDWLAAQAAETALSLEDGPPLTEKEARRLDPHTLLRLVEVELHPSKVQKGADYARHYTRFHRLPLLKLWRHYQTLQQSQRALQSRRRKGTFAKGSDQYYQFLRNIYGEMTEAAQRAEMERLYPAPAPASMTEASEAPAPESIHQISPPTPPPSQLAWAIA